MTMELHLFLPQMRMTHAEIVERALAAEAVGFEGVAFMDHLTPPLAAAAEMWEAMSLAGWVLANTTTLTVGHLARPCVGGTLRARHRLGFGPG